MPDRLLVLHPGFAKCATSSIQRAFVLDDHALGRALGVRVLGRNLAPDNGYPEVSKLMYSPAQCLEDLRSQDYPAGRYFLSNEAVQGAPDFVKALKAVFHIETTIFSIRLPELQAVSNFCYSGWLTHGVPELLASPNFGVFSAMDRMRRKLEAFQGLVDNVKLCPVEDDDGSLYGRFCRAAFGERPEILNAARFAPKMSNASISLGFAVALRRALLHLGQTSISGPARQAIVKSAQKYFETNALPKSLPAEFADQDWSHLSQSAASYRKLLLELGVRPRRADLVQEVAEAKIAEFLGQPVADATQEQQLLDHAINLMQLLGKNTNAD